MLPVINKISSHVITGSGGSGGSGGSSGNHASQLNLSQLNNAKCLSRLCSTPQQVTSNQLHDDHGSLLNNIYNLAGLDVVSEPITGNIDDTQTIPSEENISNTPGMHSVPEVNVNPVNMSSSQCQVTNEQLSEIALVSRNSNKHSMFTRSKAGIRKPRVYYATQRIPLHSETCFNAYRVIWSHEGRMMHWLKTKCGFWFLHQRIARLLIINGCFKLKNWLVESWIN